MSISAPRYATVADFEEYVEGWETDNAQALERLLERASRDVDSLLTAWPVLTDGSRFGNIAGDENPRGLSDHQVRALRRATCAQADYRFRRGEDRMAIPDRAKRRRGPDFEIELTEAAANDSERIGQQTRRELLGTGLRRATANAR